MLIDDMFVEDGDEVPVESLLQPRVVAEIAFVMARDLAGPGVTTVDALTAVGGVLPAIEIVDSRIADWRGALPPPPPPQPPPGGGAPAHRDRPPIAPFSSVNPFLDADTAYKAQALVVEPRLQAGEHLIGAKLGFTSRVKRLALGINEPVYGRLTSSMVVPYDEPVRLDQLIH